jgi:hypothetical protein
LKVLKLLSSPDQRTQESSLSDDEPLFNLQQPSLGDPFFWLNECFQTFAPFGQSLFFFSPSSRKTQFDDFLSYLFPSLFVLLDNKKN